MMRLQLWMTPLVLAACSQPATPPATSSSPAPAGMVPTSNTPGGAPAAGVTPANAGAPSTTPPSNNAGAMPGGTMPIPTMAGASAMGAAGGGATVATNDPKACQGFSFDGLKYSPGGTDLPNKCLPYHPTTNNPYAVRCVDAWPWYKTKFPGDDFCILPPPPDKGTQYGVHPQGRKWFDQVSKGDMSGYDGLSDQWTMKPGDEEEANWQTQADNPMMMNYYRGYARMRPGSHHMIVSSQNEHTVDTWGPGGNTGLGALNLPGAQRPDENTPKSLDKPAEDKGLYSKLPANAPVLFNMHHFNATDNVILKEAWTNLWWETDATIEMKGILGLEFSQATSLAVQPGQIVDLHYSWNIGSQIRLVTVFGHRHAWTTNFSSWIENSDGKLDIVYQSYQWLDEPTYRYDSMTMNPVPAPEKRTDGAASGIVMLKPGQKLHFNCHIEFTDARAKAEKAPSPSSIGTLRFANEAFNAEMCILFGSTAATSLSTPASDSSKLPDFAKM